MNQYVTGTMIKRLREDKKMTQQQLRYVLTLLSLFDDLVTVKTYMLIRLSGIHIEGYTVRTSHEEPQSYRCWFRPAWWKPRRWFTLEVWQVQSFIRQFDFIDPFDGMDVRLERIHGCRAVDDILDHYRDLSCQNEKKAYQECLQNRLQCYTATHVVPDSCRFFFDFFIFCDLT